MKANASIRPVNGTKKMFFDKQFVYSDGFWVLDEITHNVIARKYPKDDVNRPLYRPHPVNC